VSVFELLQLPIGNEADFIGVIDLVTMSSIIWKNEELGAKFDVTPLADCKQTPDDLKEKAAEWREKLIEQAVEEVRGYQYGDGVWGMRWSELM